MQRLAKRWLSSHLFSACLAEEAVELLVAYLFLKPLPFNVPCSRITGFLRLTSLFHFEVSFSKNLSCASKHLTLKFFLFWLNMLVNLYYTFLTILCCVVKLAWIWISSFSFIWNLLFQDLKVAITNIIKWLGCILLYKCVVNWHICLSAVDWFSNNVKLLLWRDYLLTFDILFVFSIFFNNEYQVLATTSRTWLGIFSIGCWYKWWSEPKWWERDWCKFYSSENDY